MYSIYSTYFVDCMQHIFFFLKYVLLIAFFFRGFHKGSPFSILHCLPFSAHPENFSVLHFSPAWQLLLHLSTSVLTVPSLLVRKPSQSTLSSNPACSSGFDPPSSAPHSSSPPSFPLLFSFLQPKQSLLIMSTL